MEVLLIWSFKRVILNGIQSVLLWHIEKQLNDFLLQMLCVTDMDAQRCRYLLSLKSYQRFHLVDASLLYSETLRICVAEKKTTTDSSQPVQKHLI